MSGFNTLTYGVKPPQSLLNRWLDNQEIYEHNQRKTKPTADPQAPQPHKSSSEEPRVATGFEPEPIGEKTAAGCGGDHGGGQQHHNKPLQAVCHGHAPLTQVIVVVTIGCNRRGNHSHNNGKSNPAFAPERPALFQDRLTLTAV